jgi:hypothetical protein
MVVYLYKEGRQTMKNIITTIAMFILTITAQAQVYQFHCKGFYNFEHTSGLNSMEVLNNNQETKLMGVTSNVVFIFDCVKNTMTDVDSFNKSVVVRPIIDSHSENNYQSFTVSSRDGTDYLYIFDKYNPTFLMCVWRKDLFMTQGWVSWLPKNLK